jgi:trimethylamine:corrinoid methyltransferase-like protein
MLDQKPLLNVGFKVLHAGARKMLKQAGAIVKDEMVKVPEFIVRQCLNTAPKGWTVFNRQGRRAMEVEGRKSYYGTSTASPNTKDALTGEIHPTRVADIAIGARVADALENIDWMMPMGSAQDVPALAADLHEFEAVVTNTTKPIVFIGYSPRGTELVFEMAAEVVGGLDSLKARPFVFLYPEPISPLVQPEEVVERIFIAADLGMPQVPGPAVSLGATGPVTLAGTVTQITAEALMCLVLAQLRNPGCPCCLSGNVQVLDMAMVCSPAQLLLGNEAIGWTKRFIKGLEVNRETIAREVIETVGPGGHFLQQRHTLDHFREELWRPDILTRQHYTKWEKDGAQDVYQRIQDKLKEILEDHKIPSMSDKTLASLQDTKRRGEGELTDR